MRRYYLVLLGLAAVTIGCAHAESRSLRIGDHDHVIDSVHLTAQPTAEQLRFAATAGVRTVINLRLVEELDFDEAHEVRVLGLEYHNPGFKGGDNLTDEIFDQVRGLLRDARRPILLHCGSGNRVGAVWAAHRVLDSELSLEDALEEARMIGLHTPAYESRVRQYVESHRP